MRKKTFIFKHESKRTKQKKFKWSKILSDSTHVLYTIILYFYNIHDVKCESWCMIKKVGVKSGYHNHFFWKVAVTEKMAVLDRFKTTNCDC